MSVDEKEVVTNKGKSVWNNGEKQVMAFDAPGPEWTKGRIKPEQSKVSEQETFSNDSVNPPLRVFKLSEHAIVPKYQTKYSAGFDIHACLKGIESFSAYNLNNRKIDVQVKPPVGGSDDPFFIAMPGIRYVVPTGLIFDIDSSNQLLDMRARSGIAIKQGITLANDTGVIDYDYTDELFVAVVNISDTSVMIKHGDRIAQGIIVNITQTDIREISERPNQKSDRAGGIGSTGV